MTQSLKGNFFNIIKENRASSISHCKKDSIYKENIIREYKIKKEPRFSQSFLNLSDQKSFENNPNPSQTPRNQLYCDPISQRLEKTLSLFDSRKKVEQNLTPLQKQNQQPLLINFGNQTSRYDSFRQIRLKEKLNRNIIQKENDDDTNEFTHTSYINLRKSNQFQKLLPLEKLQIEKNPKEEISFDKSPIEKIPIEKLKQINRDDNILSPLRSNYGNNVSQNNFMKNLKERRMKSNSIFQRGNLTNRSESQNNEQRRTYKISNNIENEDLQDYFQQTNKKRSHSSQINDKIQSNIPQIQNQKTPSIKQFTLKTINQKNQHLLIETQPTLCMKSSQYSCQQIQNTPKTQIQNDTQSFQSKVNVYMQNLKLLQNKNSQLFTNLNQISKPKYLPDQLSEFMKIGKNTTKTQKIQKKVDQQDKFNKEQHQSNCNNSSPYNQNQNSYLKENSQDNIQLCPFNQISISLQQTLHEQAYIDDYDLYQYVKDNPKII